MQLSQEERQCVKKIDEHPCIVVGFHIYVVMLQMFTRLFILLSNDSVLTLITIFPVLTNFRTINQITRCE